MNKKTLQYFHLDEVDHYELLQILLQVFGQASYKPNGSRFQRKDSKYYLDIKFDKSGEVNSITASKKFPKAEYTNIDKAISQNLMNNQKPAIGQIVVFVDAKVEGYYRYKDIFQILPVPKKAPKPNQTIAAQPFLFQFSYISSPDALIDNMRRQEKATIYKRLLNLLLNCRIYSGPKYAGHIWIIDRWGRKTRSKQRQPGYYFEGYLGRVDEYTDPNKYSQLKQLPFKDYYSKERFISVEPLTIPDNLTESLDLAFNLSLSDWEKFYMACSWYYQADAIWSESNSSAFNALVNAVECFIDKRGKRCEYCNQLKYELGKRFEYFLEKNAPIIKQLPEERRLFYQTRSHLSHGIDMFERDLKPWKFMLNTESEKQRSLQRNLSFITKLAIYNWLHTNGN